MVEFNNSIQPIRGFLFYILSDVSCRCIFGYARDDGSCMQLSTHVMSLFYYARDVYIWLRTRCLYLATHVMSIFGYARDVYIWLRT